MKNVRCRPMLALRASCATVALTALFAAASVQAQDLPAGGTPADPSTVSIATGPNQVTVTQTSQRGVINWNSFNVAQGNSIVFVQPDAGAATLNRVTGGTSSTIAGQIRANGSVYLINPNGIAITSTGSVRTGGGFVASTLDISDSDFNRGTDRFTGNGASGRVSNAGSISASGFAALLGGTVRNAGTISVPAGRVALGSGEVIALDINGGNFLQVAVPTAGTDVLIDMPGTITAGGGRIEIRAASAADATRRIVNLSGSISADSATGDGGSIILFGEGGGEVRVSGTLSARATGASGNGGFVETSGALVDFTGLRVDTGAANGHAGTWLIDPVDLIVDAAAAATISTNLATSNVTLQTTATSSTGPGTPVPGGGLIIIGSAIDWTSSNTLTLLAFSDISIQAAITGRNGGLTLTPGDGVSTRGFVTGSGAVDIGTFNLTNGTWRQVGALPGFSARDFRFDVANATFLRATGGTGSQSGPYRITDVYGLQGMASSSLLGRAFVVANTIDASGTANWNGGLGFIAIGTDGAGNVWNGSAFASGVSTGFSGRFQGGSYAISGLTINRGSDYQGLFGVTTGSIGGVVLTGGSVRGHSNVGSLIGYANTGAVLDSNRSSAAVTASGDNVGGLVGSATVSISNSHASGNVTGGSAAGGLVGLLQAGTVSGSSASGNVTGAGIAGGLIGDLFGTVSTSFATGAVTATSSAGGLVGRLNNSYLIDRSYATGAVFSSGSSSWGGGLVGFSGYQAVVSRSYATGSVRSNGYAGGLAGVSYGAIRQSYATGAVSGRLGGGGVAGVIAGSGGNLENSVYWDSYSTGQSSAISFNGGLATNNASAITSDPSQSAATNYAYKTSAYANLTLVDWIFFDGNTRPFGAWEAVAPGGIITNAHQLQLIGRADAAALSGSYTIGNDIDLSETGRVVAGNRGSYSGMWAGSGFVAIGTDGAGNRWDGSGFTNGGGNGFSGSLNGRGFTLDGLTINRVGNYQGLFGFTNGSITNVVLAGGSVTGGSIVGSLIGQSNTGATVANNRSSTNVAGSGGAIGGLIGFSSVSVSNSQASGTVTGAYQVGGLIGWFNEGSVTGSSATGAVTATDSNVGGLIGLNSGNVSTSFATGVVRGYTLVGGLIGSQEGINASIHRSYASGSVTSTAVNGTAGGLVGRFGWTATMSRSYATGSVSGTGTNGGLVGESGGNITQSYATGAVSGGRYNGGVAGVQSDGTIANSVYWDRYSTGQASAAGDVSFATMAALAVTSDPSQAGAANYAYRASAYSNFTASDWIFFDGQTRPFGAWEVPASGSIITNAHQLQLIGANASTLSGNYTLGGNIDLGETARVTLGTPGSYSGMWSASGFVSLGTNGAGLSWDGTTYRTIGTITSGIYGFSGTFDGAGFTLSNLGINRQTMSNTGLFGTVSGTVRNLTVTGTVTGGNATGGVVGMLIGGPTTSTSGLSPRIDNVHSAVTVSGGNLVGGLVGSATQRSTVSGTASGNVTGINTVGGLIGSANRSTVTGSATGGVSGVGYVGGLIGQQFAGTSTGYATGEVQGTTAVGGLIGVLDGTAAERGTATATRAVQGPSTSNRNFGRVTTNGTANTTAQSSAGQAAASNASASGPATVAAIADMAGQTHLGSLIAVLGRAVAMARSIQTDLGGAVNTTPTMDLSIPDSM